MTVVLRVLVRMLPCRATSAEGHDLIVAVGRGVAWPTVYVGIGAPIAAAIVFGLVLEFAAAAVWRNWVGTRARQLVGCAGDGANGVLCSSRPR